MPDFNDLGDRLRTDMSGLDWPAADQIRAAGNRRGRIQLAVGASAAVVVAAVILATGALLPRGNAPSVSPAASQAVRPSAVVSSSQPSTEPSKVPSTVAAIPFDALLTMDDVRPYWDKAEGPFPQPYVPNPFEGCGPDTGLPGGDQPSSVVGNGFVKTSPDTLLGGESVMQFQPGAAHRAMAAISDLIAGACGGQFQVVSTSLGGDESILVTSTDPGTVGALSARGVAIYYAIERRGDYLVWVTVVDEVNKTGAADVATTLTARAAQRLCGAVTC